MSFLGQVWENATNSTPPLLSIYLLYIKWISIHIQSSAIMFYIMFANVCVCTRCGDSVWIEIGIVIIDGWFKMCKDACIEMFSNFKKFIKERGAHGICQCCVRNYKISLQFIYCKLKFIVGTFNNNNLTGIQIKFICDTWTYFLFFRLFIN